MSYRKGENLSCCPVCGKQYYAGDFRLRWDGLFVCRYDYEERHPQDFVRGKADNMQPAVVAGCCGAEGPESAPLCPFPLEPLDNAIIGNTTSVNLSFSTFSGISSYQIYFWEFGDSQPATPTYTTTTSPYFVTGLEDNTGYFWFVTAVNEAGEIRDCSGNTRFFTTALAVPVCPTLVSPADMAEIEEESVVLDWDAVDGADGYLVYFNNVNDPRTLVADTALTSFEVSGLTMGNTYYWQVIAYNDAGESSGCGSRTFSYPLPESIVTTYSTPGEFEWEINPFTTSVEVRVLGGGGGGGGGAVESGNTGITGGAGGGGAAGVVDTFTPAEVAGSITVTVGAGGQGGEGGVQGVDPNGTSGSPGQASSFGALLIAGGGGGGFRGQSTGTSGRSSGGGGGGGVPNSGGTGTTTDGGTGGSAGGGAGGDGSPTPTNGLSASTDFGGSGGGSGGPGPAFVGGAASLWGGVGGGSGGSGINGASLQPGGNGTLTTGTLLTDIPQGGAITQVGPILGPGESGTDPVDPLLLAGSSAAGGGGSPSSVDGFNTGRGGSGGSGGRGSGGGGGGSAFSSLGSGGDGGPGGNGYVVIIETFD